MEKKYILDACCGGRMFWFNKKHPNTLYIDKRETNQGIIVNEGMRYNPNHRVQPDIIMDFRKLDFDDKSFKMVVFDPPHVINASEKSAIGQIYGSLDKDTWEQDIKKGFDECWRVLEDYGTLIFKWNETSIKKKQVLELIGKQPLFGHQVGSKLQTHWMTFMKIPK